MNMGGTTLLTEKAIEHHHVIEEQILNFNRELEAGLTEEEKQTFLNILDKMMDNLGMDKGRTSICAETVKCAEKTNNKKGKQL